MKYKRFVQHSINDNYGVKAVKCYAGYAGDKLNELGSRCVEADFKELVVDYLKTKLKGMFKK